MSEMVDEYLDLLQRIIKRWKGKIGSFCKKFSGLVSTDKNEDKRSIFEKLVENTLLEPVTFPICYRAALIN